MTELPLDDIQADLAFVLSAVERRAIKDARLIVWMVQRGQHAEASALVQQDRASNFMDALDPLCDRLDRAERVGNRKLGEWLAEQRDADDACPICGEPRFRRGGRDEWGNICLDEIHDPTDEIQRGGKP
jgi:hypothetical protein